MSRRLELLRAAGVALCVGLVASCADDTAPPAPHLVVVLVDDLGRGDVGFAGGDLATPELDAFARESVVLDRCYAAPMCSPARAQLLTGRHALDLGITRNVKPNDEAGLPLGVPTLAERLAEVGYRTALAGKWHLGHASAEQRPRSRGFESSYGHLRGWIDYTTHEIDGLRDWHRDDEPLEESGYSTDLIAAEAVRVLDAHDPAAPLFLFVSFNAPHTPLQPPPGNEAEAEARAVYAAMVERLDARIGDVLRAVDRLEARGRGALVWFASDNGANPKYGGSNGALEGGKYGCDEGSLRVPSALRWREEIPPGRSDAFVGFVDVAPTLAAAGGVRLDGAAGIDVRPLLQAGGTAATRPLIFAVDQARVKRRAVLVAPWKLVIEERNGARDVKLYDVVRDPLEREDRAAAEPDRVAALERELER